MSITKQHLWHLAYACVGRRSDYALQQADGRYLRVGQPLTYEALRLHLSGVQTIGTYLTDEQGMCHFAVFDADSVDGLLQLLSIQCALAAMGSRPIWSFRGVVGICMCSLRAWSGGCSAALAAALLSV